VTKPEELPLVIITTNDDANCHRFPAAVRHPQTELPKEPKAREDISADRQASFVGGERSQGGATRLLILIRTVSTTIARLSIENGRPARVDGTAEYLDAVKACIRLGIFSEWEAKERANEIWNLVSRLTLTKERTGTQGDEP